MNFKIKIYKSKYKLDYWLLAITPVVDTINGIFLIKNGATGFSIGTLYRLFLFIYILFHLLKRRSVFITFLPLIYFPIIGLLRGGENIFDCFTYAIKWLLPVSIILYYSFIKQDKVEIRKCIQKAMDFWCKFVPCSLIIEYILNIGIASYYDAGFKGLYYSTNDLAFVLIVCFIYSFWKAINTSIKYSLWAVFSFIAIIILSTKSSIFFAVFSLIYILIASKKIKISHILGTIVFIVSAMYILSTQDQMINFINRYSNMWIGTYGNSTINRLLIFITSGRTVRINIFFNEINKHGIYIINLLFGWITPDNAHVIEMDWHDLLCQYGIVGFSICIIEYLHFTFTSRGSQQPFLYLILISIIYSIFAGHVISGAFSGTALAMVFSLGILTSKN